MPLVDETLSVTRHRLAQMDAAVAGTTYDGGDAEWTFFQRLFAAAPHDPEVLRAVMDVAGVFRRIGDVARRADIVARVDAAGDLPLAPGPTRRELRVAHRRHLGPDRRLTSPRCAVAHIATKESYSTDAMNWTSPANGSVAVLGHEPDASRTSSRAS